MSDQINVVIIERDLICRRGLMAILQDFESVEVVGEADSEESGLHLVETHLPSVALIGTTLTATPGLGFAAEMRRRYPAVATVVISANETDDELFAAIRAGVSAYCGLSVSAETLQELVMRSSTGEYVINEQLLSKPYIAARVLDQFRNNTTADVTLNQVFMPLTDRELEILKKVSEGMTNAEIGFALGISAQTVKNHVTSILRKLAVNDRTQAVVTALRKGWISIEDTERTTPPTPVAVGQPDAEDAASS